MRPDLWDTAPKNLTTTRTYLVLDVTGAESADAVTTALASVPGVQRVSVDLANKLVTVRSSDLLDRALVEAVIADAGYRLGD